MQVLSAATAGTTVVDSPRTPSPPMAFINHQQKKPSHHLLIREIKRLRQENACLRSSVTVLQTDLRNETESRKATDETHKKIYDDILDRNTKLELDLMDKEDEVDLLKQKVDELERKLIDHQLSSHDDDDESKKYSLHIHRNSNVFGCYDIDDIMTDHHQNDMFCQPSAHDSALPDLNSNENHRFLMHDSNSNSDEDDDNEEAVDGTIATSNNNGVYSLSPLQRTNEEDQEEEEEEEEEEKERFEELVPSYIHQALISKLSSARVRLELDDLILKYEVSGSVIFRALGKSFIDWIGSVLKKQEDTENLSKLFMSKIQTGIAGFWKEILCYFAHDYEGQYTLLNVIEETINQTEKEDDDDHEEEEQQGKETKTTKKNNTLFSWRKTIADHYDHLVLMLYKHHIIDDEAVVSWWKTPLNNNPTGKQIRDMTLRFVEWIEEEEEDDSDDNDDSEEESDDSDSEEEEEEEVDYSYFQDEEGEETHVEFDDSDITMSPPHTDDRSTSGDDTDNGYEHQQAMLDNHSLHTMLNELLVDNEYCICKLHNEDQNNKIRTTGLESFDSLQQNEKQQEQLNSCSCDLNTFTVPVTEKKKKTVRIAM